MNKRSRMLNELKLVYVLPQVQDYGMPELDRDPHLFATDKYEDVTQQLLDASSKIKPGEFIVNPGFKLGDALDAFEVGYPRMDNGARHTTLASDLAKQQRVETAEDFSEVVDRLMCVEYAWHTGYSPLETIYSCVFVEEVLEKLRADPLWCVSTVATWDDALQAYILGLIKSVALTNDLISTKMSAIFPEEDFFPVDFDFDLATQVTVGNVTTGLERASKFAAGVSPEAAQKLQFRLCWITIVRQRVPKKHVHLDHALKLLEDMSTKSSIGDKYKNAFSVQVQTRASISAVTHHVVMSEYSEAIEGWRRMITEIKELTNIWSIERSADMLGFFHLFAMGHHFALTRAMLKSLVGERELMGQSGKLWVARDIEEVSMPQVHVALGLPSDPAVKAMNLFVSQATLCYMDLLTVFCQNTPRQREGLATCLISFDSLQVSAEQADQCAIAAGVARKVRNSGGTELWALEFSSWTYLRKLELMLWVLLMSFETDILQQGEYGYTYWYGSVLARELLTQIFRLKSYLEQHNLRTVPGSSYGYLVALELEAEMLLHMCTVEYALYIALEKQGSLQQLRGGDDNLRFRLRFLPFESIGVPTQPTLEDWRRVYDSMTIKLAFETAGNGVKTIRSLSQTISSAVPTATENEDLQLLRRSSVGLGIAVSAAIRAQRPGRITVEREGYHRYFPIPKLEISDN